MRHVDEGTIHALLDRELPAEEAEAVEHHLAGCGDCTQRLEEARLFFTEADRLLAALDPPAPTGVEATDLPPRTLFDEPAEGPTLPDPEARSVGGGTPEPVILIPPTPESPLPQWEPRRRSRAGLGLIAAGLVAAMGTSYFLFFAGRGTPKMPPAPMVPSVAFDVPASAAEVGRAASEPSTPPTDESPPTDEATVPTRTSPVPDTDARAGLAAAAPVVRNQIPETTSDSSTAAGAGASTPSAGEALPPKAAQARAPERTDLAAAKPQRAKPTRSRGYVAQNDATSAAERERRIAEARRATNIVAGRQATEQLSERPAASAAETTAAASPAADAAADRPAAQPPEVDERAEADRRYGVYTRVGLDEAKRILGGPVHVIAGFRPLLTGLSEATVVRVVYVDGAGHTIYLDQQRGSGPGEPQISIGSRNRATWAVGGVLLTMTASMPADDFRALVRRVY